MELILNPNKPQKISYAEVQNFEISSNNLAMVKLKAVGACCTILIFLC